MNYLFDSSLEKVKKIAFFFWFASRDAHRPWGADKFSINHNPNEIDVPIYFADTPETRRDIASYYNEIARFDYYVGEVRKELEKQGVFENTIMIIMADNGRPFPRCKTRVYDSGTKTPLIISWPKGINYKGSVSNSLISSIDIAPTLLEIAGVEMMNNIQGLSFCAILENPSLEIREIIYAEHNWHDYEAYERMVRTKDFLYVFNVASHPLYQKDLTKLRILFTKWQQKTGDTMPVNLTKDWFDRETGESLNNGERNKRDTMPGK